MIQPKTPVPVDPFDAQPTLAPPDEIAGASAAAFDNQATLAPDDPLSAGSPSSAAFAPTFISPAVFGKLPAADAPPPELPGYQILGELGRGGMGVVYKAAQIRLHRVVALKMVLAGEFAGTAARVRFLTEAEVVAKLQHPNIVQLYEFNVHNGIPYFSLEYIDGGTLDGRLSQQPLPAPQAAALVETLARAVQYAHDTGVVHRDLKPGNILLQHRPTAPSHASSGPPSSRVTNRSSLHGDGSFGTLSCLIREQTVIPKITDFGLAKSAGPTASGLTQSGAIVGTPSYMAPEQAAGNSRDVGPAADTYALGAILYECLTGRPPFKAASPIDTVMQVLNTEPIPPSRLVPKVPRDLETICMTCLQKDPAKRYPSTAALADDLDRFLAGEAILARPSGPIERAFRWARRRPTAAALIVVSALAVTTLLIGGWATSVQLGSALAEARVERERADVERQVAETQRDRADVAAADAVRMSKEADAQKVKAETAAAEADRQRQIVAANLLKRVGVIEDVLFNVDARLANERGMTSIRREVLDDVRKITDQLLKESPDDPSILRTAGRVYRSIGELSNTARDYRSAEAAFRKALGFQASLTERFPDRGDYLADQARTTSRRAGALWRFKKPKDALEAYSEAATLYGRLAALPDQPRAAIFQARMEFFRTNLQEELGGDSQVIPAYKALLAKQETIAGPNSTDPDLLEDIGITAASLAFAVEPTDPDAAFGYFRKALDAHRRTTKLGPQTRRYATNTRDAHHDLYDFCVAQYRDADLATLAAESAAEDPDDPLNAYNAACYYALAAKAVDGNAKLTPDVAAVRREKYAVLAINYLDAAIEKGFKDRAHLSKDLDLDSLSGRPDFAAFQARLDKRFPGRPITPTDTLASLEEEFQGDLDRYDRIRGSALSVAERTRAKRAKPDLTAMTTRIFALVDKSPTTALATDAATWVYETGAGLLPDPAAKTAILAARARLTKLVDKPEFGGACRVLALYPGPAGDKLLEAAAEKNTDPDVRGLAVYSLGLSLAQQSEDAIPGSPEQAAFTAKAEKQFETVVADYGAVAHKDSTLGAVAKKKLYEVRSLAVGRQAREIAGNDLTGSPLSLAGRKGSVTLVFFWANWCGYCRQLFPATKDWQERFKGRPFAVVGVNCDDDRADAKRAHERERLSFPSWWDGGDAGGRLSDQWSIEAFPTLYLIDHTGVIRKKWQGKPDPDEVAELLENLVKTAEAK